MREYFSRSFDVVAADLQYPLQINMYRDYFSGRKIGKHPVEVKFGKKSCRFRTPLNLGLGGCIQWLTGLSKHLEEVNKIYDVAKGRLAANDNLKSD